MTDKEIIQALNTATNVDGLQICCIDYENNPKNAIYLSIKSDILALINRQQAEIERLQNESIGNCELAISMRNDNNLKGDCSYCIDKAKAEAEQKLKEMRKEDEGK